MRSAFVCFLSILSLWCTAQISYYDQQWKRVDSLIILARLPKSALDLTKKIEQTALKEKNEAQQLKALLYTQTLTEGIENQLDLSAQIKQYQTRLNTFSKPAQAVVHTIIANTYLYHLLENRSFGRNASNLTERWLFNQTDSIIRYHFEQALQLNETKSIQLKEYLPIVINSKYAWPGTSVHDLIIQEAIAYYAKQLDQSSANLINYKEKKAQLLLPFDQLMQLPRDSNSITHIAKAIALYQQWMQLHTNDQDKNLFAAIDLQRLNWAKQIHGDNQSNQQYLNALQKLLKQWPCEASYQAYHHFALADMEKAMNYNRLTDTTNRFRYLDALQHIQFGLERATDTTLRAALKGLAKNIQQPSLSVTTEAVQIPAQPFRILLNFRNTQTVYTRIIRLTADSYKDTISENFKKTNWLHLLPAYRSEAIQLPDTKDYQEHAAEIKIDALPAGKYLLLCSSDPSFQQGKAALSINTIWVSGLSYVQNKNDLFVLNRSNGQPIKDALIEVFDHNYNKQKTAKLLTTGKTDANGRYTYKGPFANNYHYRFIVKKDTLDINRMYYASYFQNPDQTRTDLSPRAPTVYYFTDRSIYRPGQTVFVKVLVMKQKNNLQPYIDSSYTHITFYLRNANQKIIDSVKTRITDFGSASAQFILPAQGLTGNFSIHTSFNNNQQYYFSVEAYKRPSFSVSFDEIKQSYRINDSVTISGTVNAYAGYAINNAQVAIRINGSNIENELSWRALEQFPEINTLVTTDNQGKFTYRFFAKGYQDLNAACILSLSASITDQNGETQSTRKNMIIRNKDLVLQLTTPESIEADSDVSIKLSRTLYNKQQRNGTTKLVLQRLASPKRFIRQREWAAPDIHLYSEAAYTNWFPYDPYNKEDDPASWLPDGEAETLHSTSGNESLVVKSGKLSAGWYKLIASTVDSFGNTIQAEKIMLVINSKQPNQNPLTAFSNISQENTYQPGETASFKSWSSIDQRFVIRNKESHGTSTITTIRLSKGEQVLSHVVVEKDRGNLEYTDCFVYQNRFYTSSYSIKVPWKNKQLLVSHQSFRDKTSPGSEENWSVTVHNPDSSVAIAEIVTALYDASLDAIKPHQWTTPYVWYIQVYNNRFYQGENFGISSGESYRINQPEPQRFNPSVAQLATAGLHLMEASFDEDAANLAKGMRPSLYLRGMLLDGLNEVVVSAYNTQKKKAAQINIRGNSSMQEESYDKVFSAPAEPMREEANEPIQIRSNFNETAFYFPQLYTDSTGSVRFSFTMPDALTKWKWQTLAHTKDLSFGMATDFITTTKQLIAQANAPRFLREGDRIEFSTKIVNTTEKELSGQVELSLIDPSTNKPVDGWFQNSFPNQYFTAEAGQSVVVKFPIQVPISYTKPLQWRVIARSGTISDGETNYLPVLSNRTLVTETVPLLLRGKETKYYTLDKLVKDESASRTQEGITVSYTTNPIWYAVQALPYLSNNSDDCAEQVFNRFNANSMAALIAKQQPAIAAVLEAWKKDSTATKSALEKNASLKQIVLEETPWVNAAEAESLQKKELGVLFDIARMNSEAKNTLEKLQKLQLPNGAFPWFSGGNANSYVTNYILTGLGRLISLKAVSKEVATLARNIIQPALGWMDAEMESRHKQQQKNKQAFIWIPTVNELSYLHMRSYFVQDYPVKANAYKTWLQEAKKHWNKQNNYRAALTAQILFRNGDEAFVRKIILPSLLERTVIDTANASLYWKQRNTNFWYASPIEHQSMMIETLQLLNKDGKLQQAIQQASNWLLLNKQTNHWGNSIATANACYVLLLNGEQSLQTKNSVRIQLGNFVLNSDNLTQEAGTGYLQKRIEARFVQPAMGKIQVTSNNHKGSISWGSIFWQYFEEMDKITTSANNPLSVQKQLFVERTTTNGKQLLVVNDGDELKIGDKLISRMQITATRDMDFVHLKDLQPAGTEPENTLSGYQWQNRLGYYQSTKDVSNNYFFDRIPKGSYIIEYPMYVTHAGKFSAGLASIQCLYAPEFTSHSKGFTVFVQTAD